MLQISYDNISLNEPAGLENLTSGVIDQVCQSIINQDPYYQVLSIASSRKLAKSCKTHADRIKNNFSDLIIVGMGGTVLNPGFVLSLCREYKSNINIHFLHNTDPVYLQNLLSKVSFKNTAILAISNTGNTLETNALVGVMIAEYQKHGISPLGEYFYFITNKQNGALYQIASSINSTIIEHQQQISGRYSGLSNVTSLVAQIVGINIDDFFNGAQEIIDNYLDEKHQSISGISARSIYQSNLNLMVNIGYLQNFDSYLEWYSQIISESLGKQGGGITPIRGLGPNDQHSMMQLYLDGKKDKFYSLLYVDNLSCDFEVANLSELKNIANQDLSTINSVNFKATKSALINQGLPVRTITLKDFSAKSVGALMAHSMLEIITLARILNLNPFDQPGVELIKTESNKLILS